MKRNRIIQFFLLSIFFIALPVHALDNGIENLRQTGKAFASVAKSVSPSVVFIQVESQAADSTITQFSTPFGNEWPFGDDLFKRFFGEDFPGTPRKPRSDTPKNKPQIIGQGSGFVFAAKNGLISDKTYILTNNHVVANADRIRVKFQDGREYDATVTGHDPQSDVAVIEIKAGNLPVLPLSDSSELEVGEWVVAIGNPFGLSHTLTVGVVSAKGRTSLGINDYEDFIQTDAAINPGNSGGPLVNLNGEVVGINTAIFSRSGGYMGVGFAIPINLAQSIANQLIEKGEVTRGYLGIVIQPLTTDLAESFGIQSNQGILIAQVSDNSPADKAGLRQGDVIIAYRGKPVKDTGHFRNQVSLTPPGKKEQLTILREGKKKNLTITISELAKDDSVAVDSTESTEDIGLTVQTLTPQLAEQLGIEPTPGVVVTKVQPGSIAAMAGIESGSVILQVNQQVIKNATEFKTMIKKSDDKRRVLLLIRKDNLQRYVALSW
ncbi:serine protease Do [Nitrosomonas cryotolerans]|uniref:Serine protease Do n=1 Tax=Nitrosomonas cryotolerans ATCC 49181 TaxID=1131553 RepID=A0A1N6IVF8_9PROT|nr:DegQ family serine endoprotease [Nitrosomonas cryotolerans]SFP90674.1 serine protease Do [Nitrosomonas cryotolerans]SIO35926.1 serine protease Do [Nitrosomonas cryotolerans ATCC 49181]